MTVGDNRAGAWVRALLLPIALSALASPAHAGSLDIVGYSGWLGEWELTATVTETAGGETRRYSGPMTMKHVGICTQDGPEEKTGVMRLEIPATPSRLQATISIGGVDCGYSGQLSDVYSGTMTCPDREPVPLKLWIR